MAIEPPSAEHCIVCDLTGGMEVAGRTELRRTDATIASLVDPQQGAVQIVVSPLRHAVTILDLKEQELVAVFLEARALGRALAVALDPDGMTLHQHNGTIEDQRVPHFELWLAPRWFGTGWAEWPPRYRQERFELTDEIVADWMRNYEERLDTAARVRAALK